MPLSQIHYHFGSKQGMILALFEYLNAQLLDRQNELFGNSALKLSEQWDQACAYLDDDIASGYVRVLQELIAASWTDAEVAKVVRAGTLDGSSSSPSRPQSRARVGRNSVRSRRRARRPYRQRVSGRGKSLSAGPEKKGSPYVLRYGASAISYVLQKLVERGMTVCVPSCQRRGFRRTRRREAILRGLWRRPGNDGVHSAMEHRSLPDLQGAIAILQ